MTAADRAAQALRAVGDVPPDGIAFAPGRVNLIGEHVDYNDGLVLPMPLSLGTYVAWVRVEEPGVTVVAADFPDEPYSFQLAAAPPIEDGWHSLVRGMVHLLHAGEEFEGGLALAIAGDLPRGSGLSSSASLCIAVGRAVVASGLVAAIAPERMALIAQQVEHRFAGVACGIMDQMVIAAGEPGAAMLLDCRDLSHSPVPLPEEWSVVVIESGVVRELVEGAYNERRAQCASAARKLGVASLRNVVPAAMDLSPLDPVEARRARHVILEIERTAGTAAAIARGDIETVGVLLREGHASMRDQFEASHPEVDRQVEALGAIIGPRGGARMTGGGFGGAIVAVFEKTRRDAILSEWNRQVGDGTQRASKVIRAFN